jgi:hypothetical protein
LSIRGKFGFNRDQIGVGFVGGIRRGLFGLVDNGRLGDLTGRAGLSQRQGNSQPWPKTEQEQHEHSWRGQHYGVKLLTHDP